MKIDLDFIQRHILFLHGLSGAGKGEVVKALQSEVSFKNSSENKKGEIVHISTGDLFRELKATNPEIAKRMDSGGFIPTLEAVKGILSKKLRDVAIRWGRGEEVLVVFDGAIRRGEYEEKDKETGEMRKIPSQFEQIGECLFAGLRQARISSNFRARCNFGLKAYLQSFNKPEEVFIDATLKKAGHLLVDVTPEDAEALMLYRSFKAFDKLEKWFGQNMDREDKSGFLNILSCYTILAKSIQAGMVKRGYTARVKFLIDNFPPEDFSILDTLKIINEDKEVMDDALRVYGEYLCQKLEIKISGNETFSISKGAEKIKKLYARDLPVPRVDDESNFSRGNRINEFFDKTLPEVLMDELGYRKSATGEAIPPGGNRLMLVNGPARGVSYEQLTQNLAPTAARVFINRMYLPRIEGAIIGESYLQNTNKERIV